MDPENFLDLLHYKIGYRIYSLLAFKNHPNIIIYGKEESGKSLLIRTTIADIYSYLVICWHCDEFHNRFLDRRSAILAFQICSNVF